MAAPRIDARAAVDPSAELGDDVVVGPFTVIEAGVVVGRGTRILAQAYLCRGTRIGRENVVHMGAVLGGEPQHRGYDGAPSGLVIGDRNVFREATQVHRSMSPEAPTRIGDECYLMTGSHVGHDCRVGDGVVLASGALLGGHVEVGSGAFLGGNAVVHQHVRIGRLALLQGGSAMSRDVPPFLIANGLNRVRGVNVVGLRRAGLDAAGIEALRRLYRELFRQRRNLRLARERLIAAEEERGGLSPEARELLAFIDASRRGVCSGPPAGGRARTEASE